MGLDGLVQRRRTRDQIADRPGVVACGEWDATRHRHGPRTRRS